MKKILTLVVMAAFIFSMPACKSKPKDPDIKSAVEARLATVSAPSGLVVSVNEGVVTLSGEVMDESARASIEAEAKKVEGVKSVVNNISVAAAPPPPAPVIEADATLTQSVKDAVKDHPGVMVEVNDGVVTLTGKIKKADLPVLMQKINGTHPKKIDNKLIIN